MRINKVSQLLLVSLCGVMGMQAAASANDSIPCIIITNTTLQPVFEDYALFKTRTGTFTDVVTLDEVNAAYPQDTIQTAIRNYIRDCYNNKSTEWVILGGDVDVIPAADIFTHGSPTMTDLYYSNLDYEWNENSNPYVGEPRYFGDTVDYVPDVYVGRIVCSDTTVARGMLNKIIAYQSDASDTSYQMEALITSSMINWPDDGEDHVMAMAGYLPGSFDQTDYHQALAATVMAEYSTGYGLIVNTSQSNEHGKNILTKYQTSPQQEIRESIGYSFFDTVSHPGRYGVFFNNTCFNVDLDSANVLARSYVQNPNGGGVAYIGTTTWEFSYAYVDFHEEMFDLIFNQGVTELGKALALAKAVLVPSQSWVDGVRRSAIFGYMYLGDPQMRIWTDTPKEFANHYYSPQDPVSRHPVTIVDLVRGSGYAIIPDVKVCLMMGSEVYEIGTTDTTGSVSFDVTFPTHGAATLVASKEGYFYSEVEVMVYCCYGIRGNVDYDIGESIDVGDLDYIVAWLFTGGPPPVCFEEGDVDGSGGIDVSDMGYLVDYLFREGPAPPSCP